MRSSGSVAFFLELSEKRWGIWGSGDLADQLLALALFPAGVLREVGGERGCEPWCFQHLLVGDVT